VNKSDFGQWLELAHGFTPEVEFHPVRKWRFDWAIPERKVAVEFQGFVGKRHGHGDVGHASVGGMLRDQEKWTEGQLLGWTVILVNAKTVGDGKAQDWIERALGATT